MLFPVGFIKKKKKQENTHTHRSEKKTRNR